MASQYPPQPQLYNKNKFPAIVIFYLQNNTKQTYYKQAGVIKS